MTLPPSLADAVRHAARLAAAEMVRAYAVPRSEVLELVAALAPPLAAEDEIALQVLLPWWHAREPRGLVYAADVVAAALQDATPAGAAVRGALSAELQAVHPAKSLGRLLKRCAWRPVAGFYVRATAPSHRRDSTLFEVIDVAG